MSVKQAYTGHPPTGDYYFCRNSKQTGFKLMSFQNGIKFRSMIEFWEYLPENERMLTDVLRQIILEHLPRSCKEKLTYNVPFYYGNKRICLIWPASIPWGGFKKGVFLGFCQGDKLKDPDHYLTHGTNKKVYYKIYNSPDEIDQTAIIQLLKEAVRIDGIKNHKKI